MKKFFAIFAVVCLFAATNIFADSWTSGSDGTGNYTTTIYCNPSLTGGASIPLGNFFLNSSPVTLTTDNTLDQTWTLKGPAAGVGTNVPTYTFEFNNEAIPSDGVVSITGDIGNTLAGTVTIPSASTLQGINCTTNSAAISFHPSTLTFTVEGVTTFNSTLKVTINV